MNEKAPEVFSKSSDFNAGRKVLSVRERESIKQNIQVNTGILEATDSSYGLATQGGSPVIPPGMVINKARITQRSKDLIKVLEEGTPQPFNATEKDRAVKRRDEILTILDKDGVLETRKELRVMKRDASEWNTAMEKGRKRPKYDGLIHELITIERRLDPEDDTAGDLGKYRKDK